MSRNSAKPNRQVIRTKSWIFEALMLLLDEKPYHKITVSDIAGKAGIARQTFYRSYEDKDDVVFEYLEQSVNTKLLNLANAGQGDKQHDIVLMFDYAYMLAHRQNLKKILTVVDIENRIFREVQRLPESFIEYYKDKLSAEEYLVCRYKLCYQITGCLRVFFDWFINDMPLPVDNIVSMLNAMNMPKGSQYRNIPNIVVRASGT